MAEAKRPKKWRNKSNAQIAKVLSRRAQVAELLLRGVKANADIRRRLGLPASTRMSITRDIQSVQDEWRAWVVAAVDDPTFIMSQELHKLDHLEAEYWDLYDRTVTERKRTKAMKKSSADAAGETTGTQTITSAENEERDGERGCLDGVRKCIEDRCKLLGLFKDRGLVVRGAPESPINVKLATVDLTRLAEHELAELVHLRDRILGLADESGDGAGSLPGGPG